MKPIVSRTAGFQPCFIHLPNLQKRPVIGLFQEWHHQWRGLIILSALAPRTRRGLLHLFKGIDDALCVEFIARLNAPEMERITGERNEHFIQRVNDELQELHERLGANDERVFAVSGRRLAYIIRNFNPHWQLAIVQPEPQIVELPDETQTGPIIETALLPQPGYLTLNGIRVFVTDR